MISLKKLLTESYEVVDFRDPNWVPGPYDEKELNRTMINIKGYKIYLYRWGRGNVGDWKDIVDTTGDINDMMLLTPKGSLILPDRVGGSSKWEGARNLYTYGTKEWPEILLKAGIIKPETKVYIGNWAGSRGTFVGRAGKLVAKDLTKLPSKMVFYHGTDSTRLEQIKQMGLGPRPREERIWKSDVLKRHPEWRERAVYLTADRGQANYYAKKAVAVARRARNRNVKKVILKITIPRKFYRQLLPDDDYLMRQLIWIGVTWIDSLKEFSQVAYLGTIPPEWIEIEDIVDYGNWSWPDVDIKEATLEPLTEPIPPLMYHATFDALSQEIEQEGLIPNGKQFKNFEDIEWGVYMSNDYGLAGSMVETSENPNVPEHWWGEIVVITIDTTKLDKSKFYKDPHMGLMDDETVRSYIYRGIVPPDAIMEIVEFT